VTAIKVLKKIGFSRETKRGEKKRRRGKKKGSSLLASMNTLSIHYPRRKTKPSLPIYFISTYTCVFCAHYIQLNTNSTKTPKKEQTKKKVDKPFLRRYVSS